MIKRKRWCALLLVFAMLITCIGNDTLLYATEKAADTDGVEQEVVYWKSENAEDADNVATTFEEVKSKIRDGGTVYIQCAMTISDSQQVTWDMSGKEDVTFIKAINGTVVTLNDNASLTLKGFVLDGNKDNNKNSTDSLIMVENASLYLQSGTVLKNNYSTGAGGAINGDHAYIQIEQGAEITNNATEHTGQYGGGIGIENQSKLVINGGKISNNLSGRGGGIAAFSSEIIMNGGEISYNRVTPTKEKPTSSYVKYGGGIYLMTGDNYTEKHGNASFVMNGGTIKGNYASNSISSDNASSCYGGGILAWDNTQDGTYTATVTLNGGTIEENKGPTGGVSLFYPGAVLNMNDGSVIKNNTAYGTSGGPAGGGVFAWLGATINMTGGEISGNTGKGDGGGVSIYSRSPSNKTTFNMRGGSIRNNNASAGGGVSLSYSRSILNMTGGTIENNHSKYAGGGIDIDAGTASISGSASISGNTSEYKTGASDSDITYGNGIDVSGGGHLKLGGAVTFNKKDDIAIKTSSPKDADTSVNSYVHFIEMISPLTKVSSSAPISVTTYSWGAEATKEKDTAKGTKIVSYDKVVNGVQAAADAEKKGQFVPSEFMLQSDPDLQISKSQITGRTAVLTYKEKEAYGVLYDFKSGTRGASLPDAVTDLLPLDEKKYPKGETVIAIKPKPTEIEGVQNENVENSPKGIWKFVKYDEDSKVVSDDTLKPGKDPSDQKKYVIFTGTWTFTAYQYDINYEFVSSDSNKTLPEDVMKLKPATETDKVTYGKTAKPSVSSFKDVKDDDGTWVFKGWDKEEVEKVTSDVTFTGTWDYVPNKHKVTYKFEADGTDKELPASVIEQLPKEEEHIKGYKVTLPSLKNEMISAEDGVWTFDGWDQDEVTVGTEDITITGTWSFEAHKYTVNYEFKSASDKSLPKEIEDMLPEADTKAYGTKVTPATLDAERVEVTDGVWLFKGWSPEKIDKLTKDEMFVGTWKYYPYQAIKANDLTVYEGGLGSNNSTETGDALPEPTWKAEISGHTVTVDGKEWDVEKQGLPFTWSYLDEKGKEVTTSARVGTYTLTVYPKDELKGKDVIIDDTYALKLPEKGLKVSEVKVRDVTNNTHADSLSTETFKNVYNYVSPKEEAKGFAGILSRLASLFKSEDSALNGTFDTTTGTHTDECDPNEPHAHVYEGTTFLKNGKSDMPVNANAKIGMLYDNLLSEVLGNEAQMQKLHEKSLNVEKVKEILDTRYTVRSEFKYMDLVDMNDGNVWVGTAKNDVTIYLPYTEDMTKDDAIVVTYYDGLTRDYTVDMDKADLDAEIEKSKAHYIEVIKTDTGILFDVPSKQFGPFEILYQKSYDAAYQFESADKDLTLPNEVTALLPSDDKKYVEGSAVQAKNLTAEEVKATDGTWTFKGWDEDEKTANGKVTFIGTWEFKKNEYSVSYRFESGTEGKELPAEVEALLPKDDKTYEHGKTVEAIQPKETSVKVTDGIWTFKGYDADSKVATEKLEFVGTWSFVRNADIINHVPVIKAEDKTFTVGDLFDDEIALKGVTAHDDEDGDVTANVKVHEHNVDTSKAGKYTITYVVTDSQGATAYKTVNVHVYPKLEALNEVPVIHAEDKVLTVGDPFDPRKDVTADDKEDGDLTDVLEVIENTVDTSKAGTYTVTYKVTDKDGASVTKTIYVTVNPKMEGLNEVPTINAEDKTLTVGDSFDPKKDVTAIDKEDGDLTDKIEIINNTVDTSKAGTYTVTYKVTDKDGASTTKTIKVIVKDKEAAEQPIDPQQPDTGDTQKPAEPAKPQEEQEQNAPKEDGKEETSQKQETDSVRTGESVDPMLWGMLFGVSLLTVLLSVQKKRKASKK